jgi:hypothetical protein
LVSQTAELTTKENKIEGRLRSSSRPECRHISLGDQLESDLSGKHRADCRTPGPLLWKEIRQVFRKLWPELADRRHIIKLNGKG